MSDTDLLGASAWVWPQSYWRAGESAWLTAHKFGFLNGIDKAALGRALVSLDPTGRQLAKSAPQHLFKRIAYERNFNGSTRASFNLSGCESVPFITWICSLDVQPAVTRSLRSSIRLGSRAHFTVGAAGHRFPVRSPGSRSCSGALRPGPHGSRVRFNATL